MRCDSSGELYPPTNTSSPTSQSSFATLSRTLWHDCLGHPTTNVFHSLKKNKFISYNNYMNKKLCQSCVPEKHIHLPFYECASFIMSSFDIVHNDLWTSPIVSLAGHSYYLELLDDYSNFLWTIPIAKNQMSLCCFKNFTLMFPHNLNVN